MTMTYQILIKRKNFKEWNGNSGVKKYNGNEKNSRFQISDRRRINQWTWEFINRNYPIIEQKEKQ